MAELQSLGVKNFLTKPYNTERLLATLDDTLHGRETEASGSPNDVTAVSFLAAVDHEIGGRGKFFPGPLYMKRRHKVLFFEPET